MFIETVGEGYSMISTKFVSVGSTVRVLPLGTRCKVRYNDNGVVSAIVLFIPVTATEFMERPLSSASSLLLQKNGVIPSRLANGRKCTVEGVLCSNDITVQQLASHTVDELIQQCVSDKNANLQFKAYSLSEGLVSYSAYQQVTQLNMMGYKCCESFVVSADVTDKKLQMQPAVQSLYPFILAYAVVNRNSQVSVVYDTPKYMRVDSISTHWNVLGDIVATVSCGTEQFSCSYNSIVKYNVQKGTVVVYDDGIQYSTDRNALAKRVPSDIKCTCCGASIHVNANEQFCRCSYDNCMTVKYPVVENVTKLLKLNPMTFDDYKQYVSSKQLTSLCDIFDVNNNENIQVTCTLPTLLKAICPVQVVRTQDFFDKFCTCAGSVDAVLHYLECPTDIALDMSRVLPKACIDRFASWVEQPENLLLCKTFMEMKNIRIVETTVKLDVPPLFRNKVIYLEGAFNHGSYMDVSSILTCYGATVTTTLDNRCSCVIVGGLVRNPDLIESVRIAASYNIPIYAESDFFNQYGIDDDIASQSKYL